MPQEVIILHDKFRNLERILSDHPSLERVIERDERLKNRGDFVSLREYLGLLFKGYSTHEPKFPSDFDSFYGIGISLRNIPLGKLHVSQTGVEQWKIDIADSFLSGAPIGAEYTGNKAPYHLKIGNARALHAYETAQKRGINGARIPALVMRPLFEDESDVHRYEAILRNQVDAFANSPNNRKPHSAQGRTVAGQWIVPGTQDMPEHLRSPLPPMVEAYFAFQRMMLSMMTLHTGGVRGQNQTYR